MQKDLSLNAPIVYNKECIQSLSRQYIITQLQLKGFSNIARELPVVANPEDPVHEALRHIADILNEERKEQFDEMLLTLMLDESNLMQTYDTITSEMLKDEQNWGRIVTFIVFTAHLSVYCAQTEKLRHKVVAVVERADCLMEEKLHHWIEEQGGWQALLEHYDLEKWRINLSTAILGAGVSLGVVIGGIMAFKSILS